MGMEQLLRRSLGHAILRLWPVAAGPDRGRRCLLLFLASTPRDRSREAASLDILDRRYASGDITKEQYEQMKGDLKKR